MMKSMPIVVGMALWGVCLVIVGVNYRSLPLEVPLFYSLPWGEQVLVNRVWFGAVSIGFGGVFGINVALAKKVGREDMEARNVVLWWGVAIMLLYLVSVLRILWVIL